MSYLPHTDSDRVKMLETIGVPSLDDLFRDIPDSILLREPLPLPHGCSEIEVRKQFQQMATANRTGDRAVCFAGMGSYEHYVAAAVDTLLLRSEYYTAYTPYQPEVAQGTLQCIYEFQSLVTRLTGLPAANASLYDGGTALAEAVQLLRSYTKKNRVVILEGVNPLYRQVLKTVLGLTTSDLVTVPLINGATPVAALDAALTPDAACVAIAQPNFVGQLENAQALVAAAHAKNVPVVVSVYPVSLGLLDAPGNYDADVVTGDGQCFGPGLNNGGPYLGIFACKKEYIRLMPGRIAGATEDDRGQRGFVLTLQTREQHIRRERATSNICTNQGLMMLAALFNLALLGREGVRKIAELSHFKALYLSDELAKIGLPPVFPGPFFNEFVIRPAIGANEFINRMLEANILAGVHLGRFEPAMENLVAVAVTELRDRRELDDYVTAATRVLR